MATGGACGKFILLGEHFVVHGSSPALAFPLPEMRCEVDVSPNHHPHYNAEIPGETNREIIERFMARATYAAADAMRVDVTAQPLRIESRANFRVSRGFGSSAAFAVALVRAFGQYRRDLVEGLGEPSRDELLRGASAVEQIFHGRPSGVDAAVILEEHPVRFENGAVVRRLKNNAVDFVVADSGARESCGTLVERVSQLRSREPAQWEKMSESLRAMVKECEHGLENGKAEAVGAAVREAHGILAELGLSAPAVDAVLERGRRCGALAGKVSGAGGGGAVVLVAPAGAGAAVARKLRDAGVQVVSGGERD